MKITYSHSQGVTAELPAGDELARHAADAYGHTLNTPERRNRTHTAREFAQAIREVYDMAEPRNAAIVEHLESLEPMKTALDIRRDFKALSTITGGIRGGNVFTCAVLLPDGETVKGLGTTLEKAEDTAWYAVKITLREAATA